MKLISDSGCLRLLHQVDPARVRLELAVAGHREELAARRVQRRNAGVAAACDVEHREIQRQPDQIVAQRLGDELVDLVADLAGHAAHDGAGCLLRRRAARSVGERVQERRDQADLLIVRRMQRIDVTGLKLGSRRSTVSISIEWPKR